jgi:male-specific lethal 1
MFGKKHAILSYQWDNQEEVKVARDLLKAKGVPTWMDIDGGMQTDIYDSMAEGVGNAAVCIPFMTKKYSESKNCQLVRCVVPLNQGA